MRVASIDQSLSKTALILWDDGEPISRFVFRSGNSHTKGKRIKGVPYFDLEDKRMEYITDKILTVLMEFNPDKISMEGLSFGSVGNATRDLGGLYYVMRNAFFLEFGKWDMLSQYTPMTLKKIAREYLPEEQRTVPKPNGKKGTNLRKMEKGDMIAAVPEEHKWLLDGYLMSGIRSGLDDIADAYFIGVHTYNIEKEGICL